MNREEREKLSGLHPFLFKLYVHVLRRHMDFKTGIVGISYRLSISSIAQEMIVIPISGVESHETGLPSRSKIVRALDALERSGLITKLSTGVLVFELNYATFDLMVEKTNNQAGTRPEQQADTQAGKVKTMKNSKQSTANMIDMLQAGTEAEPEKSEKNAQAGTIYPLSDNNIIYNNYISPENENAAPKTTCKQNKQKRKSPLPEDFHVTENHLRLANENQWPNPYDEIEAFKDHHLAHGNKFVDWDRAFNNWLRNAKRFNKPQRERFYGNSNSRFNQPRQTSKTESFDQYIADVFKRH